MGTAVFEIICGEKCIVTRDSLFHKYQVIRCSNNELLSSSGSHSEAVSLARIRILDEKNKGISDNLSEILWTIKDQEAYTGIEPVTERPNMPHKLNKYTGMLDNVDDFFVDAIKGSAPEREVRLMLEQVGFTVIHYKDRTDYDTADVIYEQFAFKRMKLDFALPTAQIAIEVQGDYWHGNTTTLSAMQVKNKLRDEKKKRSLARHNWKLLEIWEKDLKRPELVKRGLYTKIIDLMDL